MVIKAIFNLVKAKIEKKEVEKKKQKGKDVELKIRKSSLKRFGQIL